MNKPEGLCRSILRLSTLNHVCFCERFPSCFKNLSTFQHSIWTYRNSRCMFLLPCVGRMVVCLIASMTCCSYSSHNLSFHCLFDTKAIRENVGRLVSNFLSRNVWCHRRNTIKCLYSLVIFRRNIYSKIR